MLKLIDGPRSSQWFDSPHEADPEFPIEVSKSLDRLDTPAALEVIASVKKAFLNRTPGVVSEA